MIEVFDLTFRYVGRKRPALRQVSFACRQGEVVLVLGPSGCGKSTLALCLNGAIPHSIAGDLSGHVRIAGSDTDSASMAELAQRVGLVFQDPEAQFCMLRVVDEVAFGLENLAVPAGEMDARIDLALDQVGLLDRREERIEQLSGGQKQRLALACVLAQGPRILVFDEPTAQLDPAGAADFVGLLGRLRAARRHTIVLVEHRLDEIMHLVDRAVVLDASGSVVDAGAPRHVLRAQGSWLRTAGVWLPQVSELALRLEAERGITLPRFPLTVDEAVEVLPAPRPRLREPQPTPEAGALLLEVQHLTHRYPGAARLALDDLSFELAAGELVAVVGPNGAGKSTLARLIAGILKPPRGSVRAQGQVGYVFQYPEHQFVGSTVMADVAYGPKQLGLPDADELASAALAEFGLTGLAEAHPFSLSLGEQRRLSVADMLVLRPPILILDEPTFGQDRANAEKLTAHMQTLARAGRAVVAITHDVKLIARVQRVLVLLKGQMIFDGPPRRLFANEHLLRRANLVAPALWQLSQRLGLPQPLTEVDEFLDGIPKEAHEVVRLARS